MSHTKTELFAPTFGIEKVGVVDGKEFFSSPALIEKYIEAMEKCQISKPAAPMIKKLVEKKVINPCYHSKAVASFIKFKINATPMEKSLCAFLDLRQGKIWIFMDANTNFIGFAPSKWLAVITLHEAIHLYATKKKKAFLSLFKRELDAYYINFFHLVFQLKKGTRFDVHKIVTFIFNNYEMSKSKTINLQKYYLRLKKEFEDKTTLDPEEFEKILIDYMVILKLYFTAPKTFFSIRRRFQHVLYPLDQAYDLTYGRRALSNISFQELFLPSEVIAVSSEIVQNPKLYKALSQL